MISAQDIREKAFGKATFGGYAMSDVDDFLEEMANDVAASQKESSVLKGKMKVLVDKIEEYRATEDAMRKALLSAQRVAEQIEGEAKTKADALLESARKQAQEMVTAARSEAGSITEEMRVKADAEAKRLGKAKAAAAEYIEKMSLVTKKQMDFFGALREMDMAEASVVVTPAPAVAKAITQSAPVRESLDGEAEVSAGLPSSGAEPDYFRSFETSVRESAQVLRQEEPFEIPAVDAERAADREDTRTFRF